MKNQLQILRAALVTAVLLFVFTLQSQGVDDAQKGAANLPTAQQVIDYLKQTIDWHHHLTVEEQLATRLCMPCFSLWAGLAPPIVVTCSPKSKRSSARFPNWKPILRKRPAPRPIHARQRHCKGPIAERNPQAFSAWLKTCLR